MNIWNMMQIFEISRSTVVVVLSRFLLVDFYHVHIHFNTLLCITFFIF